MKYFEQTRNRGESHIGLWVFVFWITSLGWIASQLFLTSPLLPIVQELDPDLANEFLASSAQLFERADPILLGLSMLGFLTSSFIGLILGLITLNRPKGRRQVLGILTAIFVAISFICLFLLAPFMSSPESSAVLNKILAISPMVYALILLTFPASLIALYLGQKFILKRSILSLHTAFAKYRWGRSLQAVLVTWGVLGLLSLLLHVTGLKPMSFTFDASRFFIYAAVSLAFIPLQSATEEIVFRGYLNQAIENVTRNKWIAFTLTSFLFMCLHLANPEALSGAEAGILPIVMSGYFFFGFAACLLVWIDDGLESAIGVHAANNTFAAVFVNYENSVLPTPSVFQVKTTPVLDSLLTIIALSLIVFLLYRIAPKPAARQV